MDARWKERQKPGSLEAKFTFPDYATLREFLDQVADAAEAQGVQPNISFGKDYASVLIYAMQESLGDAEYALAESLDRCYEANRGEAEE